MTVEPLDARRRWKGRLAAYDDGWVVLEAEGQVVRLPFGGIARARLVVDMEDLRQDFARGGRVGP
jgi:ribosome maturation factor RimP